MLGTPDPKRVFVVHGRNENIRRGMFAFLRSIGLEPIEWTQAVAMTGAAAPYVGEVLDTALSNAQAIIVLMTPDDEAKLLDQYLSEDDPAHDRELTPQARANVLFEAGLALGRAPERTILVEIGILRPFSDIGGRHVIRLDDSTQRRQSLANRLNTAGCEVDISGTDWHTEGVFDLQSDSAHTVQTIQPIPESTSKTSDASGDAVISKYTLEPIVDDVFREVAKGGKLAYEVGFALGIAAPLARSYMDYLVDIGHLQSENSEFSLTQQGREYLAGPGPSS